MRYDVVTIFPEYLEPLKLSLLGKAREKGLVDLHLHDLREYTFDRHRTVDDTPYGGGAGMVMKAEPWGLALDEVLAASPLNASEDSTEGAEPAEPAADTRPLLFLIRRWRTSWRRRSILSSPRHATKASTSACWTGRRRDSA